jgi:competence protein ComEA
MVEHPEARAGRLTALLLSPRALIVVAIVITLVTLGVVGGEAGRSGAGGTSTVDGAGMVDGAGAVDGAGGSAVGDGVERGGAGHGDDGTGASSEGSATDRASASDGSHAEVVVHVAGAVAKPGLHRLPIGARVDDAVTAAGGASAGADLGRVNLARMVVDGEQLYVPRTGEEIPVAAVTGGGAGAGVGGGSGPGGGAAGVGVVDLNTADQATLETLPGVGPAIAGRILAWRQEHGRFASVEDLLDVSGIGDAKFADLQDRVRV